MERIRSIRFAQLRNNEHAEFHKAIVREIKTNTPASLGIEKIFPAYEAALENELTAIDVESGSRHTTAIEEADIYRDEMYRSLVLETRSKLVSYKPEYREAGAQVKRILDQVGDMRKKPYNQETETIQSLVNQLKENYADELETTGLIEAVNQLDIANKSFNERFGERATDVSGRPDGDVRVQRLAVDETYTNITDVINGLAVINGDTAYRAFMDKINYLVDYNKTTLAQRRADKKAPVTTPPIQ